MLLGVFYANTNRPPPPFLHTIPIRIQIGSKYDSLMERHGFAFAVFGVLGEVEWVCVVLVVVCVKTS